VLLCGIINLRALQPGVLYASAFKYPSQFAQPALRC
jgi:hypothetical protein